MYHHHYTLRVNDIYPHFIIIHCPPPSYKHWYNAIICSRTFSGGFVGLSEPQEAGREGLALRGLTLDRWVTWVRN